MEYDKIITNLLISNKNKIRNGILRKIKSKYPNILKIKTILKILII